MAFQPQFTITPKLLAHVEEITALRQKLQTSTVQVSWIPALQKDSRSRNTHSSTAIEGNPLNLEQVKALEEGKDVPAAAPRSKREIANYLAGLKYIEKNASKAKLKHEDVFELQKIIAGGVMDQGDAGCYRTIGVRVGNYVPPPPQQVSGFMFELLDWMNTESLKLSPIITSAIVHYRFEAIHPFADGNGRTGRALALWELYRRGFDTHHIFSVDEFYWEDRARYYKTLDTIHKNGEDMTAWLEYAAEGLLFTLTRVWERVQKLSAKSRNSNLVLRPKQEELVRLLQDKGSLSPREIWDAMGVSKQGAMDLLNPLIEAGVVKRVGTKKSGKYTLG